MRIAFLDLPFHFRTGSSLFFRDLLTDIGPVDTHYVYINDRQNLRELIEADYDLYILWQLDPLVPFFVYHQCRVVVVPMYDGCHGLGKDYWATMRGARSINFCKAITEEQSGTGIQSLTLQYFPNPAVFSVQTDFDEGRALFWQRRPEQGLTSKFADVLLKNMSKSVHVHNAPDTEASENWPVTSNQTESRWSSDQDLFNHLMDTHNIFLAPRIAEGIGMAFLEAMARGMFVIAANAPTANEYITDEHNGALFPLESIRNPKPLCFTMADAKRMGENARDSIERGFLLMQSRNDEVIDFLTSTPRPSRPIIVSDREERLLLKAATQFFRRPRYFKKNIRKTFNYHLRRFGVPRIRSFFVAHN